MAEACLPCVDYLRKRFQYDPETGKLYWRPNAAAPREWNSRWAGREAFTARTTGYRIGRLDGKNYLAHRVIWAILTGSWPTHQVDHVNGDREDNRVRNLREVSNTENARNATVSANNTSGVTGVWHDARRDRWVAEIKVDRRKRHLGSFATLEEAAAARKAAERQHGFHENHGKRRKK